MSNERSVVWATVSRNSPGMSPSSRREFGRSLAIQLLLALDGGRWTIGTDARGKPIACGLSARHVSIAHTGNVIAAAASSIGPVGIDVEYRDATRDLNPLALAAFGPAECEAVASDGVSAFYRIWTLREAISKATGDGMALVTDRVDRIPTTMVDGSFVAVGEEWLFAHETIEPSISLALVVRVALTETRAQVKACSLASLRIPT